MKRTHLLLSALLLAAFAAPSRAGEAEFQALAMPGMLGGSHRQARAQAEALSRIDPPRAVLLRAEIAIGDKDFDGAESLLAGDTAEAVEAWQRVLAEPAEAARADEARARLAALPR